MKQIMIALIAAVAYGSWAFYANWQHAYAAGIKAACVQGLLSFSVTFVMTVAMEWVFRSCQQEQIRFLLTAFVPLSCILLLMASVHLAVGTPDIIKTITPSAIAGSIYCVVYTLRLNTESPAEILS